MAVKVHGKAGRARAVFFNQLKEREAETPPMWQQLLNLTQKISWLTAGAPRPPPPARQGIW